MGPIYIYIYSRSHKKSKSGVYSVVLPNGRGHVVMNKGCRKKKIKPHFTQFLFVFVVRGGGVFDCSGGCPADVGMVSVGIC
jgi:hypothetical protein